MWHKYKAGEETFLSTSPLAELQPEFEETLEEIFDFDADDVAEMWSEDLSNANFHILAEFPNLLLNTLRKNIKNDDELILKIILEIKKSL